jgi:hypothetical protein
MSIVGTLQSLQVEPDALVTVRYSDGTDVFIHNETEVETALSDTDVIERFSELLATPGIQVFSPWGDEIIDALRDGDYLDEYARDFTFADYLSEVIRENIYEFDFIDRTIEKYDYKRGFCTLTAEVRIPAGDLMAQDPYLGGWTVSVDTASGTMSFDA